MAKPRIVCVHRKGATRAFGPGHPAVCEAYRAVGQPILIPGDMGTASYVMAGTQDRHGRELRIHLPRRRTGFSAERRPKSRAEGGPSTGNWQTRASWSNGPAAAPWPEEMPEAYKDIDQVVETVHGAGLSKKVARLKPICVIKG